MLLPLIVNDIDVQRQMVNRFAKFMKTCVTSNNYLVQICVSLVLRGSQSSVSNTISHICHMYSLARYDFLNVKQIHPSKCHSITDEYMSRASVIRDMIDAKSCDTILPHLDQSNINDIIVELCTN